MTSERILNAVAAFLRPKVEAAGGVFALSETVANTLGLLAQSPWRFRVILQYQREAATANRGERALTMLIIVQASDAHLAMKPGDRISTTSAEGEDGLLLRCTLVSGWARKMRFTNQDMRQEWPQMMAGASYWLNDPGFPTKQIAHEFTVHYGVEAVTTENVTA